MCCSVDVVYMLKNENEQLPIDPAYPSAVKKVSHIFEQNSSWISYWK